MRVNTMPQSSAAFRAVNDNEQSDMVHMGDLLTAPSVWGPGELLMWLQRSSVAAGHYSSIITTAMSGRQIRGCDMLQMRSEQVG